MRKDRNYYFNKTKKSRKGGVKILRTTLIGVMVMFLVLSLGVSSWAFHESANLVCSDCHTMHASEGGAAQPAPPIEYLLKNTVTELCLNCHDAGSPSAQGPAVKNSTTDLAGGDFYYVTTDDGKGHNVESTNPDNTLSNTPPGGTALSSQITCATCHDPHGNSYYRILRPDPDPTDPTSADVTGIEDDDWESKTTTDWNRYQSGIATFCSDCHEAFSGSANTGSASPYIRHPQNAQAIFPAAYANNYGATYLPDYPFEDPDAVSSTDTSGPDSTNSEVMCLSCHRAHATNYSDATRWNTSAASGTGEGCNKCHAK